VNYCRECNQDFGSVSAFDAHRVGKHAYTVKEADDGRRCLDTAELTELGWRRDKNGRWRTPAPATRAWEKAQ